MLARRRREKIISFTLDKDGTLIWALGAWAWNHLLAWGGSEMLCRGEGQKMASRGGRPAIYPPTHTYGGKALKVVNFVAKWLNLYPTTVCM